MANEVQRYVSAAMLLILALPALMVARPAAGAELVVHGPWVREMPPVAEHAAAYMRIENASHAERVLVRVESPQFARVELHETILEGGTMRMRHRENLRIPTHGSVALAPGGYHLMLMSRRGEPLVAGDHVVLELHFADDHVEEVVAEVRRSAPDAHHHGDHRHRH
jgi:periplasmic copper chaperone A